jgi:putative membrane protein
MLSRAVRAETEAEYGQGPYAPKPPAPAPAPAKPLAKAPVAPVAAAPTARRSAAYPGYAAESARTATRLSPDEREARKFLRIAAAHARFEVEASRLAATRAHAAGVRAFAAELLQYHEAADAELLHLLHARGMAPPMMENTQRKALQRLARLGGPKFDREFVELVGRQRQHEDVQHFERAVAGVNDPVLRGWIDRQLPSLRQQQSAAAKLASWDARRGEPRRPPAEARQRVE